MKTRVFIDGSSGTAGLRIRQRIAARDDIELLEAPYEKRRDPETRKEAINAADVAILCLPDEGSVEAVALVESQTVAVIDTSTAHRTAPGWDYGFPELAGRREKIRASKRIANPGCHAGGFIVLVEPLVAAGIVPPELGLTCFSLTGYSGGGKKMIAEYESGGRDPLLDSPRLYGLGQTHKHLREMTVIPGLQTPPVFCPIVADYCCGMETAVSLFKKDIRGTAEDIRALYAALYAGPVVHYEADAGENGLMAAGKMAGRDDMEIAVFGSGDRILLVSRFDNLGKGASGAAVQNMNLVIGADETAGLVLGGAK
ncbi:MAG TPA: N-acetyl-gamma-glutamyl-phosphate reductase [Oscillospiraceae bacterium]|nr:N-acetyl-gamma-glutamyl-phosphate reductase [Oscillospiraceae bacterium]HPS76214.1 N-acetyl-gamma-glutamyl-phosphate reductase [Oscillospiraceae bacterium]